MTTPTDTKALRELLAKATPGPWHPEPIYYALRMAEKGGSNHVSDDLPDDANYPTYRGEDVPLIVALRNAAPALLDEIEKLRDTVNIVRSDRDDLRNICTNVRNDRAALKSEVEKLRARNAQAAESIRLNILTTENQAKEIERLRDALESEASSARRLGQLGIEQRLRAALRGEEAPRE